jgi:hypothetical protein
MFCSRPLQCLVLAPPFAVMLISASAAPTVQDGPNPPSSSLSPQDKKDSVDEKAIKELIQQMADDSFDKREDADRKLEAIGSPAVELLRMAAKDNNGKFVLSCGNQANPWIGMWDAATGNQVSKSEMVGPGFYCVTALPDNRHCVSAGKDGVVRLWQWSR